MAGTETLAMVTVMRRGRRLAAVVGMVPGQRLFCRYSRRSGTGVSER
jgi:hypothetical protein